MKSKIGSLPWSYVAKLSASENHKGFFIRDSRGYVIAEIIPVDEDGKRGERISKLIVESVNGVAMDKFLGLK